MFVVIVLLNLAFVITVAAGNDFVYGELRVDLGEIYNAKDYQVWLSATVLPAGGYPDYTTAWLGVDLDQYNGQPYSAQFSQVGILTKSDGIRWFVYAEPGVTCLRGTQAWGNRGCQGSVGDLVSLGNWNKVELLRTSRVFGLPESIPVIMLATTSRKSGQPVREFIERVLLRRKHMVLHKTHI